MEITLRTAALVSLLVASAIEQDLDQGGSCVHAGVGMQELIPSFCDPVFLKS